MKLYEGHLYETMEDWHPVVVRKAPDWRQELIFKGSWLSENCPNGDDDYDAWCHPDDDLGETDHRTVYFFRDPEVAFRFALRWS